MYLWLAACPKASRSPTPDSQLSKSTAVRFCFGATIRQGGVAATGRYHMFLPQPPKKLRTVHTDRITAVLRGGGNQSANTLPIVADLAGTALDLPAFGDDGYGAGYLAPTRGDSLQLARIHQLKYSLHDSCCVIDSQKLQQSPCQLLLLLTCQVPRSPRSIRLRATLLRAASVRKFRGSVKTSSAPSGITRLRLVHST
jgi:hypothetical protein